MTHSKDDESYCPEAVEELSSSLADGDETDEVEEIDMFICKGFTVTPILCYQRGGVGKSVCFNAVG